MAGFLLDTKHHYRRVAGPAGSRSSLRGLLSQQNSIACCAISVTEIYAGARPHEEVKTDKILRELNYIEISWDMHGKQGC